uniref:AAA+ ATPase domain-containing protein n=1 Tax=Leersia perrieri TaxID=77586 RepID=A0A0D9XGQ9_9ORYZ
MATATTLQPPLPCPATAAAAHDIFAGDEQQQQKKKPFYLEEEEDDLVDDDLLYLDDDLRQQVMSAERHLCSLDEKYDHALQEIHNLTKEFVADEAEMRLMLPPFAPLVAAELDEILSDDLAVVTIPHHHGGGGCGERFVVPVLPSLDRALLTPPASVALHGGKSMALVAVLPPDAAATAAAAFEVSGADMPELTYDDIGGMEEQKREVREAIELPLTQPELFAAAGIDPPRGVLLYGPPGTGKTMLVKAVARATANAAAFFRLTGADLVAGGGARMVRDVFRLAREKSPSIVFIDEADAVAAARRDGGDGDGGAARHVNRVLIELLTQMDGFDGDGDAGVRVIMATNNAGDMDPALLRPGRIDRKVEFTAPRSTEERRMVLDACAKGMSLDGGVDLDDVAKRRDGMSAAEIAAVCREAGMRAIRDGRCTVTGDDFDQGYHAVVGKMPRDVAAEFQFYN